MAKFGKNFQRGRTAQKELFKKSGEYLHLGYADKHRTHDTPIYRWEPCKGLKIDLCECKSHTRWYGEFWALRINGGKWVEIDTNLDWCQKHFSADNKFIMNLLNAYFNYKEVHYYKKDNASAYGLLRSQAEANGWQPAVRIQMYGSEYIKAKELL